MFGRIYCGELKKIVRPKAMIVLSVVLLIVLIAYAIFYNFVGTVTKMVVDSVEGEEAQEFIPVSVLQQDYTFNEENVNAGIAMTEAEIQELEERYKTEKTGYNVYPSLFSAKARLTALKYVRDNKLYGEDTRVLGVNYTIGGLSLTADGFASDYMSVVVAVMAIYAIVIGAGLLADEMKNGTIKLLLTRPITKNQLLTAKFLAALTVSLGIAALFTLIGFVYGAIAFPVEATKPIYLVFNGTSVFRSTVGGYLFGTFVMSLVRIATMCLIAYFLGTIARKKTTGIIVTIIIHLGIVSAILGLLPVQIALLSPNMGLMNYFSPASSVPIYGNFFISLAVYVAYVAAITFGLYFSVNKRDVI